MSYRDQRGGQTLYLDSQVQKVNIYGLQPRHVYVVGVTPYNSNKLGAAGREVTVTTLSNEGLQPANVSAVALNSSVGLKTRRKKIVVFYDFFFF